MKKLLVSLFIFPFIASNVLADCYIGFACSLAEATEKQQKIFDEFIDDYFEKEAIETNYHTGMLNIVSYRDLFVFNKLV